MTVRMKKQKMRKKNEKSPEKEQVNALDMDL